MTAVVTSYSRLADLIEPELLPSTTTTQLTLTSSTCDPDFCSARG